MKDSTSSGNKQRAAANICATLRKAGFQALLAGGCVRDQLLGRVPNDFDIATNALPEQVSALFKKVLPIGAQFGIAMVVVREGIFEVATFRRDGAYSDGRRPDTVTFTDALEDARRRDFTINAMFKDLETGQVLDYVGGRRDLQNRVIRAVGIPRERFCEDRLRLLRAVRFAARFDFSIDPDTLSAIQAESGNLLGTSLERIRDELLKMLTEGRARVALELLDSTNLLEGILPEITAMKGIEQPEVFHPEGDVFQHTLLAVEQVPGGASATLALGVLFHDVGKPVTQTFEDRIRFNRHEKAGARIAESICRRLRMSVRDTKRIAWLIENHMRLKDFMSMRKHRRIQFAREEGFDELLALCRADALASHGDISFIEEVEAWIDGMVGESFHPAPLLSGDDLIAMGYHPGKAFKPMLAAVEEQQLEGNLETREQARAFVRKHFPVNG